RFLFRVYTPRSDGFTDETRASSRDAALKIPGSNKDIFATKTRAVTARLIADHMWWARDQGDARRRDNLVSWSSSMLFLIRYIFYRHYDMDDKSSLDDIHLLVVDTKALPADTFIRDTDLISAFEQFDSRATRGLKQMAKQREGVLYFGEYLSQGTLRLDDKCSTVSAHVLIYKGLLHLHDGFQSARDGEDAGRWVIPVQKMRDTIQIAREKQPASLELLDDALDIASEYGMHWRLPIAIQLLALLPERLECSKVLERILHRMSPSGKRHCKFVDRC
ncbi:hypothetical protein M409DRAFT_38381, partial [Zasmidium cellare ATCC 36951]